MTGRLAQASEVAGGHTILKLADHSLFKMVRYVLLRPLRPELDIQLEQFKEASSKPAQLKAFRLC
jgi:hypothetical protein